MINQVKVKQTETYKDSQGEHIVCKGKLIIPMRDNNNDGKGWLKPIIISETEKIEVDDWGYGMDGLFEYKGSVNIDGGRLPNKVLALPEHFSPKHLQAIADGKLKDGDKVYVECVPPAIQKVINDLGDIQSIYTKQEIAYYNSITEKRWNGNYGYIDNGEFVPAIHKDRKYKVIYISYIKLNSSNYITIFPKEETWDDIKNRSDLFSFVDRQSDKGNSNYLWALNKIFKELEKHYQVPKRK